MLTCVIRFLRVVWNTHCCRNRAKKNLLKGLPPVMLMRAEHEVLWDEISEMGRTIAGAGQEVRSLLLLLFRCYALVRPDV